jgi:hypothetical protein
MPEQKKNICFFLQRKKVDSKKNKDLKLKHCFFFFFCKTKNHRFFFLGMRVVQINADKTCRLCDVNDSTVLQCEDHASLDGIENYKLGIFVDGKKPPNSLATYLISMLRMKYGMSKAGSGACGTAYWYLEEDSMTKNARGEMENARLAKIESNNIMATMNKLFKKSQ